MRQSRVSPGGYRRVALVLAGMCGLGAAALVAVISLQERADSRRQAQVVLADLRKHAVEVRGAPFQATDALIPDAVALERYRETKRRFEGSLGELRRLAPGPEVSRIAKRSGEFLVVSDGVFALLAQRTPDFDWAGRTIGTSSQPGGAEYALGQAFDAADAEYGRDVRHARLLATVGSIGAMGLALLAFSFALFRSVTARGRAELLARDNERLAAASRQEALTDALTGLGNRRRMMNDLDAALAAAGGRPLAVAIFDLDGFKSYNDMFGHPAGDALLTRLGRRLAESVAGRGGAYRMGGDEFCVVTEAVDPERVFDDALEALAESGAGFDVTASRGSAVLPAEAGTVEQALQLADQRLYGHKRARPAGGPHARDALIKALAAQERELAVHSFDAARLAAATARKLGLSDEDVARTRLAAELLDIGKAAVPEAILSKPGPLDDEEWSFIQRHTLVGERILAAAPALANVAPLVRSSRERPDGRGYPDGLSREEIPLGSRILAVADAFEAMVSDRPHRKALSPEEALAELRDCSGTQFDPDVVTAFVAVYDELAASRRAA